MDVAAYHDLVWSYYVENMPDNVISDWYRYIVTDGVACREVEYDYLPEENEMVFFCKIEYGKINVALHKNGAIEKK